MKASEPCVHWYILEPDRFVGIRHRRNGYLFEIGFAYLVRGRCKKCDAKLKTERISWSSRWEIREAATTRGLFPSLPSPAAILPSL